MRTLTLLFIGVFPILLCAQTRSHIEALQEAYSYCKTPLVDSSKFDTVFDYSESIMEFQRNGSVYLYAVHIPEKNVCVFVSNEKQYTTIIGSMSNDIFPLDTLTTPPALFDLLEHHMDMIDSLHKESSEVFYHRVFAETQDTMNRLSSSYVQGQSLLKRNGLHNNWKQSKNNAHSDTPTDTYCDKIYNKFCPTFFSNSCGRTVAGCSAVAMGQVLWYWNWPDYSLKPLSEIRDYLAENQHLPEIPSAQEMETNGVSMNELQIQLLQKIEELTLYILQQEQRINELEQQVKY